MSLSRRVKALERHLGRADDVTWQQAYAAWDRVRERLNAHWAALGNGRDWVPDEAQEAVDAETLRWWRRQRGIPEPDHAAIREQMITRFKRLAAEPEWVPSQRERT